MQGLPSWPPRRRADLAFLVGVGTEVAGLASSAVDGGAAAVVAAVIAGEAVALAAAC